MRRPLLRSLEALTVPPDTKLQVEKTQRSNKGTDGYAEHEDPEFVSSDGPFVAAFKTKAP